MEYGVTVGLKSSAALIKKAKSWAERLHLPFFMRQRHGSLETFCAERGLKALLIASHLGPQVFTREGILRYHPSMGVPRIRTLERGGTDHLVEACAIEPGTRYLDCTLGLAADAAVASFAAGPTGKITALEASPVLYMLAKEGLQTYPMPDDKKIEAALRRIVPYWGKAEDILPTLPNDSYDVVYFDPMFRHPVGNSASMQPLRPASYHKPLDKDMIREALRVAPRVVVKEREESLLRALGASEIQGGKYSRVKYGIIRRNP